MKFVSWLQVAEIAIHAGRSIILMKKVAVCPTVSQSCREEMGIADSRSDVRSPRS